MNQTRPRLIQKSQIIRYVSWAFVLAFVILSPVVSYSDEFEKHIQSFVQELCIDCHDSSTETRLDFSVLDRNLSNADVFRKWLPKEASAQVGQ